MTAMNNPLSEAIGLAVLHLIWQGALVAVVLAIVLKLLSTSSANLRYALSCTALAAVVTFGVATAWSVYDPVPAAAFLAAEAPLISISPAADTAPGDPGTLGTVAALVRMHSSTIAVIWLIGVALLATRLAVSWTRTRRLASADTSAAPAEWQAAVARLSETLGLRRVVRLVESAAVEVPSVIGFLKPVVLVPAASLGGLSPRQLEMILAHELAHIRRHDYLVNMLQSVAETLLFYHPAAWWISRQIRVERENCCDDLAIATCGNPIEYARALTALEELREAPLLAVASNGGSLLGRVRRLVGLHDRQAANGWTALAAAVSFAVVMMITSLPVHADREEIDAPPPASEIDVFAFADAVPAPPPPPDPEIPEIPEIPEDPEDPDVPYPALAPMPPFIPDLPDIDFDFDFDFDFEPGMSLTPVVAPAIAPVAPAGPPRPMSPRAVAPRPLLAAADMARLIDFDLDDDQPAPSSSGPLSVDELISLRIHGVTPAYITEMRALFPASTLSQVRQLKTMSVTAAYIAELRAAGVTITTPREAVSLRTHNVKPDFVKSLAAAGYTKLTARDLTRLAAAGVNADYIREMSKYRDNKK